MSNVKAADKNLGDGCGPGSITVGSRMPPRKASSASASASTSQTPSSTWHERVTASPGGVILPSDDGDFGSQSSREIALINAEVLAGIFIATRRV